MFSLISSVLDRVFIAVQETMAMETLIWKTFNQGGSLIVPEFQFIINIMEIMALQIVVVLGLRLLYLKGNRKLIETLSGILSIENIKAYPHSKTLTPERPY